MLINNLIKRLMSDNLEYNKVRVNTPSSEGSSTCSKEMAREQITRKWEIFAGRNRFYCDGRLMTAPHSGVFLLTVFLITGTSALFFAFDCPYLARNVSVLIPIIGGVLFLFTMSALLRTSLTDPGIIPRATQDEAAYVEQQIEVTNSANSPTYRPPPRTKEILIKGQTVKLKYCFTCKIFRPPRASHCSLCDNCVDRFDHHCPWVGNCVGRRNYRFFYMFIVSLAFLAVFIFACAIAHLILITKDDRQFLEAVRDSPTSLIVGIVCFFSVWSILGLAGFHTYLTTSNQTTNEDIKGSFTGKSGQDSFNPYSQGNVCLNCFHILCGPVTPSLIDRRGVVTDEYRMEMEKKVITTEQISVLRTFNAPVQNGAALPANSSLPEIYRQTVESTGTYSPLKKQLQRAHIVPSKTCATDKIIPSGAVLKPKKCVRGDEFFGDDRPIRGSPAVAHLDRNENAPLYDASETYYTTRRHKLPSIRPYTPPEKRYSANFGLGIPERKRDGSKRPRSSFVYENVHANEFCVQDHCNNINNNNKKVRNNKFSNSTTNVRVGSFPKPDFNRMYIQDNFD